MQDPLGEVEIVWDPRKASINLRKHKIAFEEAATIFQDPLMLTKPDPDHSFSERRFLTVGLSFQQRLLQVAHTEDPGEIHIISARRTTAKERYDYEND